MLNAFAGKSLRQWVAWLLFGTTTFTSIGGCSRQFWRKQADRDGYNAAAEKLNNPHWQVPRLDLTPDPRSRFYDPYDPDCAPLPPDDPAAHEVMHCVSGRKGYKNWHKFGKALSIENPQWLEPFGVSVENADPVVGHAFVDLPNLTLPQSVQLANIHNRDYQTAIEDLYLSALDLTLERFRMGVRYLGVSGSEPGGNFLTNTNAEGTTTGNVSSRFGISQLLPAGGQIAVELANTTLWVFGNPGSSSSATDLSYRITQPLMFNAGRKIALEPLTQAERNVLYAARTLARFRQTFFVDVAAEYLGLLAQYQSVLNSENNIRQIEIQLSSQEAIDAYRPQVIKAPLPELPENFVIPESLEGRLVFDDTGVLAWYGPMSEEDELLIVGLSTDPQYLGVVQDIITFAQSTTATLPTAQLRSNLNRTRNSLANQRRALADQLDGFKINLGLPPNVSMEVDLSLLKPFELIDPELTAVESGFRDVQEEYGQRLLPQAGSTNVDLATLQEYISELKNLTDKLYVVGVQGTQADFSALRNILELTEDDWEAYQPGVRFFNSKEERDDLVAKVEQDLRLYRLGERDFALSAGPLDTLVELIDAPDEQTILNRLDANQNGTIELAELPPDFLALPTVQAALQSADPSAVAPDAAQPASITVGDLLDRTRDAATQVREDLQRVAQSLQVVQVGVRVETIPINRFSLPGSTETPEIEEVVRIGLENRHDLMNARAAVMDARRRVEIAANRLEAALDVEVSGRQGLEAGGPNRSNYGAAIRFTSPLDMVTERNLYREALVAYQRQRRTYMLLEDNVKFQIRRAWRQLIVQQERLRIDRETIRNVAREYDSASLSALGQGNALSVLNALNSVLGAQNTLISNWVSYETNRLNIFRDMGTMQVNNEGMWADQFYMGIASEPDLNSGGEDPIDPPAIPGVPTPGTETP